MTAPHVDERVLEALEPRILFDSGAAERGRARAELAAAIARATPTEDPAWHAALMAERRLRFSAPSHTLHWCAVLDDDPGATTCVERARRLAAAAQRTTDRRAFATVVPRGGIANARRSTADARHFVVLHAGRARACEHAAQIELAPGPCPPDERAPCAGTSLRRADWYALRDALAVSPDAGASLEVVESAAFAIALEPDVAPRTAEDAGRAAHAFGVANRWHDKALQLVVFGNGRAAVLGSFAAGLDGLPGLAIAAELAERAREAVVDRAPPAPPPLHWPTDSALAFALDAAERDARGSRVPGLFRHELDRSRARGLGPDACIHAALYTALRALMPSAYAVELREFVAVDAPSETVTTLAVATPELALLARTADPAALVAFARAHRDRLAAAKRGDLPLAYVAYLADRDPAIYRAYHTWLATCGGVELLDTPFFAPTPTLLVLASGVRLPRGVALFGRFGVPWPSPALCAHYFLVEGGVEINWHAHAELEQHIAPLAAAFDRTLPRVLALAPTS